MTANEFKYHFEEIFGKRLDKLQKDIENKNNIAICYWLFCIVVMLIAIGERLNKISSALQMIAEHIK